jgi:serpin B
MIKQIAARVVCIVSLLTCASTSQAAPSVERDAVVESNTAFAVDLYSPLAKKGGGNIFFSPYSVSTALAMTWAGARGKTAEEMSKVLHFGKDAEAVHKGFSLLRQDLAGESGAPFELAIADRLFAQAGFKFLDPFLALAKDRYAAPVEQLDFKASAEPSRLHINQWVEQQTHDRIKELLKPKIIDEHTRLVLVNAIYFKGGWEAAFDKSATAPAPFTANGKAFDVPMMSQEAQAGYSETDDLQALVLPYKSGTGAKLAMLVLLPSQALGLAGLEGRLSAKMLGELLGGLPRGKVRVFLPKFKMESAFSLKESLAALGMKTAFDCGDPTTADFSGMDGKRDLCISAVVHKAFVDVNEEGTEAAAATAVVVKKTRAVSKPRPVPVFRADRPFLFAIVDEQSRSVLFMGRVEDPRQ